jgi:hypothetical protein
MWTKLSVCDVARSHAPGWHRHLSAKSSAIDRAFYGHVSVCAAQEAFGAPRSSDLLSPKATFAFCVADRNLFFGAKLGRFCAARPPPDTTQAVAPPYPITQKGSNLRFKMPDFCLVALDAARFKLSKTRRVRALILVSRLSPQFQHRFLAGGGYGLQPISS